MIPVRFLILGTLGKKMAKLFYHLIKNYGRKKTLEFLNIVRTSSDALHIFRSFKVKYRSPKYSFQPTCKPRKSSGRP
jgi:hypothetical protein